MANSMITSGGAQFSRSLSSGSSSISSGGGNGSNSTCSSVISSGLTAQIAQFRSLYDAGVIDKNELKVYINKVMTSQETAVYSHPEEPVEPRSAAKTKAVTALASQTKYRASKSPETLRIRQMINGPIQRRFQMQCAMPDSKLFGTMPPKRLVKELFNEACTSPLKENFTRCSAELEKIPGDKVVGIVKWKIRKMRGNSIGEIHTHTPTHTHTHTHLH